MLERLLIAGSGGQGIVLIGRLLATAAVERVPCITFFPAYGAEVRGGTSHCQVILSSEEIASPVSETFDAMIIMNQASADRFAPQMTRRCLIMLNSSLCVPPSGTPAVTIKATDMANDLGDTRVANVIMLGAFLARRPWVATDSVEAGMRRALAGKPESLIHLNVAALRHGLGAVPGARRQDNL